MRSLRSRLIYWLLKIQKSTFDPRNSLLQQRASVENELPRGKPRGIKSFCF